jgi:hypothetical protein
LEEDKWRMDEEKLQPAADDNEASKQQPAEARPTVDPGVRIGELVKEFEKAKLPFKKVEGLMPQVKASSGETMVGLSVFNPAKKDARHKFLTRPQFEESRKLMAQRLKIWHKMLSSSEDADDIRNTAVLEAVLFQQFAVGRSGECLFFKCLHGRIDRSRWRLF